MNDSGKWRRLPLRLMLEERVRRIAVVAVVSSRHPRRFLKEPTYPYLQARYMRNGI